MTRRATTRHDKKAPAAVFKKNDPSRAPRRREIDRAPIGRFLPESEPANVFLAMQPFVVVMINRRG